MLKGYANAHRVFNDDHFLKIAIKNGHFIIKNQLRKDGGLNRNYKNGKSSINGYLEDYATTIDAFLGLYQITLNEDWLQYARELTDYCFQHFYDSKSQMFFFTSDEDEALIARKIDTDDNVISSSNSIMANNLFLLGHYFYNQEYTSTAKQMLHNIKERALKYGSGAANWLSLYLNLTGDFYEVAISGKEARERIEELNTHFIPNKLIVGATEDSSIPLLENKYNEGQTTIYVCVDGACQLPVTQTKEALKTTKYQIIMKILQIIFIALVALLHFYFMILEMFYWTKPKGMKAFGLTKELAEQSKVLAANQGLYNGFLAAGLVWAILNKSFTDQIAIFFLVCVTFCRHLWVLFNKEDENLLYTSRSGYFRTNIHAIKNV